MFLKNIHSVGRTLSCNLGGILTFTPFPFYTILLSFSLSHTHTHTHTDTQKNLSFLVDSLASGEG